MRIFLRISYILLIASLLIIYPSISSMYALLGPISGLIEKKNVTAEILPKLQSKPSNFELKNKRSFFGDVYAASNNQAKATSYIVADFESGEIYAFKNHEESYPVASLTKIMTAVVALDLAQQTEEFVVTLRSESQIPTKIGLKSGQRLTLTELLHAVLMTSANDAAEAVREGIDRKYGQDIFIQAMNFKASFLGLTKTHFADAQGFDSPQNYSSAADLARLTHYALTNYPLIAEIVRKDYIKIESNSFHGQYDLYNWNGLIGVYPNTFGVKIGNTEAAGKTTVVVSEREGRKIMAVVLGASDIWERDLWAASLLDEGFTKALGLPAVNVTHEALSQKYSSWRYFN